MPVNPQFLAARAAEHRNRLLTHVGLAEPLEIPFRFPHSAFRLQPSAFRIPQLLLTERMRLELQLAGNAFVTGREPLLGDVFVALWRLHPEFCRPRPGRLAAIRHLDRGGLRFARLWYAYGSWRAARVHRWLSRCVARCDLFAATELIRERFAIADQDAPGAPLEATYRSPVAPGFCYYDDLVEYFATTYHLAPAAVLDLPRALIHQLYRTRQLSQPDGELAVFAPSDSLL
jgi:hypothetical protein